MTAEIAKFPTGRVVRVHGIASADFPDYESRCQMLRDRLRILDKAMRALKYDHLCTFAAYRTELRREFNLRVTKGQLKADERMRREAEALRVEIEADGGAEEPNTRQGGGRSATPSPS
jgi:hypothetical protein